MQFPSPKTLKGPGELVGSLPKLFGEDITDSLAVVVIDTRTRIIVEALRADLPAADDSADAVKHLVEQLSWLPSRRSQYSVLAVALIRASADHSLRSVARTCRSLFERAGVAVEEAIGARSTATGGFWFPDNDEPRYGVVTSPGSTIPPGESLLGMVAYVSQAELDADLTPDSETALSTRATLLAARGKRDRRGRGLFGRMGTDSSVHARFHHVDRALSAAAHGTLPTVDEELVELILALRDPIIAPACWAGVTGRQRAGAERLWRHLMRTTPGPDRATPAALLAATLLQRGDALNGGLALGIAHAADPRNALVRFLMLAYVRGLGQEQTITTYVRLCRNRVLAVIGND